MGWFTKAVCGLGILLTPLNCFGQAQTAVPISGGPVMTPYNTPAANVPVYVCAVTALGAPCNPTGVTLYSDYNLTQAIGNPISTNFQGLYNAFTTAGFYLVQIQATPTNLYSYYYQAAGGGPGTCSGTLPFAISCGGSAANNQPGAFTNLVSPGGTITGPLTLSGNGDAGNAALKIPPNTGNSLIQYVGDATTQFCSDSYDGLSWGSCVADLYTAYVNIMTTAPGFGGVINTIGNAQCGGPNDQLWLMGSLDSQWSNLTASVSGTTMNVTVASVSDLAVGSVVFDSTSKLPYATITALGTGSGGIGSYTISVSASISSETIQAVPAGWLPVKQRVKFQANSDGHYINPVGHGMAVQCAASHTLPDLWISGSIFPLEFINIGMEAAGNALWLGLDSTSTLSSPVNSTTNAVDIEGGYYRVAVGNPSTDGPAVWVGGATGPAVIFNQVGINANTSTSKATNGADATEAVVVRGGAKVTFTNDEVDYGDLKVYDSPASSVANTGSLTVNRLFQQFNWDGFGTVWIPTHYTSIVDVRHVTAQSIATGSSVTTVPPFEVDTDNAPWLTTMGWNLCYQAASSTCANFAGPAFPASDYGDPEQSGPVFGVDKLYGLTFQNNGTSGKYLGAFSDVSGNMAWQSYMATWLCPNYTTAGFIGSNVTTTTCAYLQSFNNWFPNLDFIPYVTIYASTLGSVTGISGTGLAGTGNLLLNGFNHTCTSCAATVTITSGSFTSATVTNAGYAASSAPTSAACAPSTGTAVCPTGGVATITSTLVGPPACFTGHCIQGISDATTTQGGAIISTGGGSDLDWTYWNGTNWINMWVLNGATTLGSTSLSLGDPSFGSAQTSTYAYCETSGGATTLSGSSTTTGLSCLPANSIIDAITYRVTTTITTAVSFTLGDSGSATRYATCYFSGGSQSMTAGATGVCNDGYYQLGGTALGVKITPNTTPGAGALRLIVYYHTWTAPTS